MKYFHRNISIQSCLRILSLVFLFSSGSAFAQYSEDEYDDYMEQHEYGDDSYNANGNYSGNEYNYYRKSIREEDLYNKKRYGNSDNFSGSSVFGRIEYNRKKSGNESQNRPWQSENKPSRDSRFDNDPAGLKDIDHAGADALSGKNPDRGNEPKPGDEEGGKDGEVPPPPDEPDVPVDSAIPFLIAGGIAIAAYRFYIQKRVSA